MVEIFAVINKILDLKIVQWALLTLCVALLASSIWGTLKYNALRLENALLKTTVADFGSAIQIQNRAIQEVGEEAKAYKANYEQANKRAAQIAIEGQKTLQDLMNTPLVGTCDQKVTQSLGMLQRGLK
jgi:hypothetical protein